MALVNCPECATEVSDSALNCPKCGKQLRKPKRSFFGKMMKWVFIVFNLLMIVWLVTGLNAGSQVAAVTEAQKAGAAIGTGIGVMLILTVWTIGDIILGLFVFFTRAKA